MCIRDSQYTYLGVEISKYCAWDAHTGEAVGKRKAHVCNMDAILTNPHLETKIKICIMINLMVPKLEYAGKYGKETRIP